MPYFDIYSALFSFIRLFVYLCGVSSVCLSRLLVFIIFLLPLLLLLLLLPLPKLYKRLKNVVQKEQEKITKYSGLRVELGRMWDCECMVVPIVI